MNPMWATGMSDVTNYFRQSQPPQSLIKVTGIDGAKAYQMPPNSAQALFHESEDIFYIKSTDGAGFPTIREFKYVEQEQKKPSSPSDDYVTKEEFEAFKKEVINHGKCIPNRKPDTKDKHEQSARNDAAV